MKKKLWILGAGFVFLFSNVVSAQEMSLGGQAIDGRYEQAVKDAQRNKELLEIWKEHVRTLTEERNAAYKELEALKIDHEQSQGSAPQQFGGVESMPLPLGSIMEAGPNFQAQLAALEERNTAILKELSEAQNDKNILIKEKEEALSELESVKQASPVKVQAAPTQPNQSYRNLLNNYEEQKRKLASANGRLQEDQRETDSLREELERVKSSAAEVQAPIDNTNNEALVSENEEAQRQIRELSYQNQTLKAKSEKLEVVEKELQETRAYLTPLTEDLQQKNQELEEKIKSAELAISALETEKAGLQSSAGALKETLSAKSNVERQNQDLHLEVQRLSGEIQRLTSIEEDFKKLQEENKSIRLLYSGADSQSRKKQIELDGLSKKFMELKSAHENLLAERDSLQGSAVQTEKEVMELKAGIEGLRAASEKAANLEAELAKTQEELKTLQGSYIATQKSNEELRQTQAQHMKAVEALKSNLKANYSDIKNLKTNLESYLESLVSNFEERQN